MDSQDQGKSSGNPIETSRSLKRKKSDSSSDADDSIQPRSSPIHLDYASDSLSIAHHYNSRPNLDKFHRTQSPIIHLRSFNNWVKSVLVTEFVSRKGAKRVLDLACGKGGDLPKWNKSRIEQLVGVGILLDYKMLDSD